MFKSIICQHYNGDNNHYTYLLIDSDFTCKISVPASLAKDIYAVAFEYNRRNLPVAKNVALYYLWQEQTPRFRSSKNGISITKLDSDARWMQIYSTHIKYIEIYPCVLNQALKLHYANSNRFKKLNVEIHQRIRDQN